MKVIKDIIVHCTATPAGRSHTVDDIRRWHVQGNHWADIGYHWVVLLDGTVSPGRPENIIGAHCRGHNTNSLGVVYVGGVDAKGRPADTRTPAQKTALRRLLLQLHNRYPAARIVSHHDYDPSKACPSFDATNEYKDISDIKL